MKYLTGKHALNIGCELLTCGDWHRSGLRWVDLTIRDSEDSVYGDWGIELNKQIPGHDELFHVANHIRAILDLMAEGNFAVAQGMKEDYICNDDYTSLVFELVNLLRHSENWTAIDAFMLKEYGDEWSAHRKEQMTWTGV
jgi:hypothetical protein